MSLCCELQDMLFEQLSDLNIFSRLLRFGPGRQKLLRCLTSLTNKNKPLAAELQRKYTLRYSLPPKRIGKKKECNDVVSFIDQDDVFTSSVIEFGLRLGSFLSDAGWLSESIQVLSCVATRIKSLPKDSTSFLVQLDCLQRLLLIYICCI